MEGDLKAKRTIDLVVFSQLIIDIGCYMIHAEGDQNDQNYSFVADLVATWEHSIAHPK